MDLGFRLCPFPLTPPAGLEFCITRRRHGRAGVCCDELLDKDIPRTQVTCPLSEMAVAG